jgi:hypothetical protein
MYSHELPPHHQRLAIEHRREQMQFLGIYREPDYSPGRHLSNDAKILRLVGRALERYGASVRLVTLEEARPLRKEADLIFSMCQGPAGVTEMEAWKQEGLLILNDPLASRRTYRNYICAMSHQKELGFPKSAFLDTAPEQKLESFEPFFTQAGGPARRSLGGGGWLKRADVHATQVGDVVRVTSLAELQKALKDFNDRGLTQAVLQEHCEGDEVKFYAVRGGRLFWPFYPRESEGHPFEEKVLATLATMAAESIDLGIYGGDAIISPEGKITLIDLNDWPSFAPCRGAAASAIALYLKETLHAHEHQSLNA